MFLNRGSGSVGGRSVGNCGGLLGTVGAARQGIVVASWRRVNSKSNTAAKNFLPVLDGCNLDAVPIAPSISAPSKLYRAWKEYPARNLMSRTEPQGAEGGTCGLQVKARYCRLSSNFVAQILRRSTMHSASNAPPNAPRKTPNSSGKGRGNNPPKGK